MCAWIMTGERVRFGERGAGGDGDPDEGTIPVQLSDGVPDEGAERGVRGS